MPTKTWWILAAGCGRRCLGTVILRQKMKEGLENGKKERCREELNKKQEKARK
jgi:hypothetical protein